MLNRPTIEKPRNMNIIGGKHLQMSLIRYLEMEHGLLFYPQNTQILFVASGYSLLKGMQMAQLTAIKHALEQKDLLNALEWISIKLLHRLFFLKLSKLFRLFLLFFLFLFKVLFKKMYICRSHLASKTCSILTVSATYTKPYIILVRLPGLGMKP
jgi:hypothetical protein